MTPPGPCTFSQGREAFRTSVDGVAAGTWQWWGGERVRRGPEESRKARKKLGRMESAIRILCFFLPRASTITSPVGGSEGGTGWEEQGAGEEGTGEEGRDGGGGGHGEGETSGGESGDAISEGLTEEDVEAPDGFSSGGGVITGEPLQQRKGKFYSPSSGFTY